MSQELLRVREYDVTYVVLKISPPYSLNRIVFTVFPDTGVPAC